MDSNLHLGASVNHAFDVLFLWLPLLIGSILILIIGYFIAKGVASLVHRTLRKLQLDQRLFATEVGSYVQRAVKSPAALLSKVVYWIIFLGAISLAISTLGIAPLTAFVETIYAYLPNVFAALLIFIVAAAVSGSIATIATRLMGDTPTGKLVATILPTLTMIIATFMILNQLQIAKEIVTITYAGLIATMVLGVGLSTGLGGRETASELIGKAYDAAQDNAGRVKRDVQTGKDRL